MRFERILVGLLVVPLFSGCASLTTQELRNECIVSDAIASAVAGSVISPLGAGAGMLVGVATGVLFCSDDTDSARVPAATAEPVSARVTPEQTGYFWSDDQDGDGVLDNEDSCPFTPASVAVDDNGCAKDNDGDGVPDYVDQCPETPLGTVVNTDGCEHGLMSSALEPSKKRKLVSLKMFILSSTVRP